MHADHMVPLWHSGPERMTVALGAVALVPFGSGSNCACFLRTGGLDGAPELRLDGPRLAGAVITRDADDDVYYYIRWRLKLEGETENMGVCTKERKGVTAEVLSFGFLLQQIEASLFIEQSLDQR